ncbi:hypothetical protein [Flavobacterium sp. LC2016-13]|jgi:fatty acid desaturase|uniref:hypothetical protein n=1 Tax=Flavobacterium sp. LC2016-13 TaxID=2675875 RepID=UPI0012B718AA|nr:hypothetical protein [Flavobacterium sp. LC2016-13]MTD67697.1 hypothetical protein [Flavobacterium sp. LC2016-13]
MGKNKLLDKLLEKSSATPLDEERVRNIEEESSLTLEDIKDRIQDREERKKYAKRTFSFLVVFTFTVLGIVIAVGLDNWICFHLSDTVLITLITTSLASIVGIFAIVMRYLFKQSASNT